MADLRRFRNRDLTWTPAHRLLAAHPDRLRTWRPQLQVIALPGPARGAQITRIWAASVLAGLAVGVGNSGAEPDSDAGVAFSWVMK
jgi:hypothetical protein